MIPIVHNPLRCAGHPTIGETRLSVHSLIGMLYVYNWDVERLLEEEAPIYTAEEVEAGIAYYHAHPAYIDGLRHQQRLDYENGLHRQRIREGVAKWRRNLGDTEAKADHGGLIYLEGETP